MNDYRSTFYPLEKLINRLKSLWNNQETKRRVGN